MKLLYSTASPYARMVRIVIEWLNLTNQVQLIAINPLENPQELAQANPLTKIPCLCLDEQNAIFDSEVILRYLDSEFGDKNLFSAANDWQFATEFSMLKGLIDSTVGLRQEQMRENENVRSPFWTARFTDVIIQTLSYIERHKSHWFTLDSLDIRHFMLLTALDYIEFRHTSIHWRNTHSKLATWFDGLRDHPSVIGSRPQ